MKLLHPPIRDIYGGIERFLVTTAQAREHLGEKRRAYCRRHLANLAVLTQMRREFEAVASRGG
jgi:hypothetical protein